MSDTKMTAPEIRATAKSILADLAREIAALSADDGRDPAWKQRERAKLTREMERAVGAARNAHAAATDEARDDARRRYAADPVGTAADEQRRVARELKIGRLVAAAERERSGPHGAVRVVEGRVVDAALVRAGEYVTKATTLYFDGAHEESQAWSQAALDLGLEDARGVHEMAQTALDLANPARRQAIIDRNAADIEEAQFGREILAAQSAALRAAADAASAHGDHAAAQKLRAQAASASAAAKIGAWLGSRERGEGYVEPEGVFPGVPTGDSRGIRSLRDGEEPSPAVELIPKGQMFAVRYQKS